MVMDTVMDHIKGLLGDHLRGSEHDCSVSKGCHERLTSLGLFEETGGTGS